MPTPIRSPAILRLVEVASAEAATLGSQVIVEHSDRSEAAYVHVQRGDAWFGYRVASHLPVYQCSADYQQVIVPHDVDGSVYDNASRYLRRAIRSDGRVVADPEEVSDFIRFLERKSATDFASQQQAIAEERPHEGADATTGRPIAANADSMQTRELRTRLTALELCQIRHRFNLIARWTFELLQRNEGG